MLCLFKASKLLINSFSVPVLVKRQVLAYFSDEPWFPVAHSNTGYMQMCSWLASTIVFLAANSNEAEAIFASEFKWSLVVEEKIKKLSLLYKKPRERVVKIHYFFGTVFLRFSFCFFTGTREAAAVKHEYDLTGRRSQKMSGTLLTQIIELLAWFVNSAVYCRSGVFN